MAKPYYIDFTKFDPEIVVKHVRECNDLLTQHGVSGKARASELKVSEQTLKQYAAAPGTQAHRLITPQALDTLRALAITTHWRATDRSMSDWALAEGPFGSQMVPKKWEVIGGRWTSYSHMFLPRALEVAEDEGGSISEWNYEDVDKRSSFATRSRFRKMRWYLEKRGADIQRLATEFGIDRYYTGRIGIEYKPWRVPPPAALVEKMDRMIAEDKIL